MSLLFCALLPLAGGVSLSPSMPSAPSGISTGIPTGIPSAASERATLTPKAYRTWRIELPTDPFRVVSGAIPIPHAGGAGFRAEARGAGIALDTDGDGEVDRVVEGTVDAATEIASARVTLAGRGVDGAELSYPVRLERQGGVWKWAPGGALEGRVAGTSVRVLDHDGNGRYGDVGGDAIVVGEGDVAQLLGETIHVDGRLVRITVDPAGTAIEAAEFDGATGVLDLSTALAAKGVLLAAVVASEDGKQSFDLSGGAAPVPAGRYRLIAARLGLGEARVTAEVSSMAPIEVAAGATAALAWGAPVTASFAVEQGADGFVVDPRHVRYVGRAGEQWVGWDPIGKSPSFRVKDKATGDVLADFVFPGACCGRGFVPAAVSVPSQTPVELEMTADTWAFGTVTGAPRTSL